MSGREAPVGLSTSGREAPVGLPVLRATTPATAASLVGHGYRKPDNCSCRLGDDALRLAQRRHAELGAQGVGLSDLRVDATPTALVTTPLPLVAIPLALLTLVVPISETTITRIRVHYILVYNNMYTRRMTYSLLLSVLLLTQYVDALSVTQP